MLEAGQTVAHEITLYQSDPLVGTFGHSSDGVDFIFAFDGSSLIITNRIVMGAKAAVRQARRTKPTQRPQMAPDIASKLEIAEIIEPLA